MEKLKSKTDREVLLDKLLVLDHAQKLIESIRNESDKDKKTGELQKLVLLMQQNNFTKQDIELAQKINL